MADSVKFIFKTIIKVPCFIAISYLIANLFLFSMFYFKFLGISYSVMQTALENNYLPPTELAALQKSLDGIYKFSDGSQSEVIPGARIYIGNDSGSYNNNRKQYGKTMVVGIEYQYKWILPLMPEEYGQKPAKNLSALAATGNDNKKSGLANEDSDSSSLDNGITTVNTDLKRQEKANKTVQTVHIKYTIPGLQYYSDLE